MSLLFASNLHITHRSRRVLCGAHLAPYPVNTGVLSLGVKWPERQAHHSSQSSLEVKNARDYMSAPSIRLYGMVLAKYTDNFTLYV
jgi:hypothetical protein